MATKLRIALQMLILQTQMPRMLPLCHACIYYISIPKYKFFDNIFDLRDRPIQEYFGELTYQNVDYWSCKVSLFEAAHQRN